MLFMLYSVSTPAKNKLEQGKESAIKLKDKKLTTTAKSKTGSEKVSAMKRKDKKLTATAKSKTGSEKVSAMKLEEKKLASVALKTKTEQGKEAAKQLKGKKLPTTASNKIERGKEYALKLRERHLLMLNKKADRVKKSGIKLKPKTVPKSDGEKEFTVKAKEEMSKKNGPRHTVVSGHKYLINEYRGDWLDDKKHGYGVWTKTTSKYIGYWKFGKPDGNGTYKVLDPKLDDFVVKYAGNWRNGKKHGRGIYLYDNSSVYEGQWVEGRRTGWGKMYYPNGDVYLGDWLNDRYHGQGVMHYANKNAHVGEWRDGLKNGRGTSYSHSEDLYFEGIWVDGSPTSLQQLLPSELDNMNQDVDSYSQVFQLWNKNLVDPFTKFA